MAQLIGPRDVEVTRTVMRAQARCTRPDGTRCLWRPIQPRDDHALRHQARAHVLEHPDHVAEVVVADVARYGLPSALVSHLRASTASAGSDASTPNSSEFQED